MKNRPRVTKNFHPDNDQMTNYSGARPSLISRKLLFGPHGLRVIWRLLIYFAVLISCALLLLKGVGALLRALHWRLGNQSVEGLLTGQSLLLLSALIAIAVMARIERRSLIGYWIPRKNAFGRNFWEGLGWGLAVPVAIVLLIWLSHGYSFGTRALSGPALIRYLLLWAAAALINAIAENLAILGYPLFTLTSAMRFWPAALLLTGIFTIGHISNAGENRLGLISIFLQGFFFCLTICRTGDLWFSVGLHAGGIFAEDFLLSTPDSGVVYNGHLLNSSFHGSPWLTGGSVGPEASLMAFIVLVLALILFDRIHRKREVPQGIGSSHGARS
jgi:membrane protease YdiL (CAAX protease family)